jgi:GT2 family glycosyltransferase
MRWKGICGMNFSRVGVVIINWNNARETLNCLRSLQKLAHPDCSILVVDNGSSDDSVQAIRAAFPEVEILETGANLGYTGGNNAGMRKLLQREIDWIFLLNNDAWLNPHALDEMVGLGEKDPTIGIIGPLVYHANPPNSIQSAGGLIDRTWRSSHRGMNQLDTGQFQKPDEVDWVSGCALLARRTMIDQIGLLDERFFMYYEELEWCLRAKKNGFKVILTPKAHVWHSGVSPDYQPKPYITYYTTRNHFLVLATLKAGPLPWAASIFRTARTLASWTLLPKWVDKKAHKAAMERGIIDTINRRWGKMPEGPPQV